jgi:hypothetical protein
MTPEAMALQLPRTEEEREVTLKNGRPPMPPTRAHKALQRNTLPVLQRSSAPIRVELPEGSG